MSVFSANTGKYGPEETLYLDTLHTELLKRTLAILQLRITSWVIAMLAITWFV